MIDNFLGIDTEGEWGDTGHYGFCHNVACSDDSFFNFL